MQNIKGSKQLVAAAALSPRACGAHTGVDAHSHTGFLAGFMHPFTGFDHLAVMLAVGIWGALAARRGGFALLWAPLGFAAMLLVGALLGLKGAAVPAVEPMIAASLVACGLLVMTRLRVEGLRASVLVGIFAIFHGAAHGSELAGLPSASAAITGMLMATLLLHAVGICAGWTMRRANRWVGRAAGAGVAITGISMLFQLA